MRVLLVGSPVARARLRAELEDAGIEVVAEYEALDDPRTAPLATDGVLIARAAGTRARRDADPEWVDDPLTPREMEVLQLLAEGLANKAIADRLGISDQTVKFHLASLFGKLGAANRTEAVRRAFQRGLITL